MTCDTCNWQGDEDDAIHGYEPGEGAVLFCPDCETELPHPEPSIPH